MKIIKVLIYILALALLTPLLIVQSQEITFPRAFGIAIDDLGWMQGSSLGDEGGPWRAGVKREMNVKDYMPIVEIGKAVGVRIQGVFILSELDRENASAKYPTVTKYGTKFDNSKNVGPRQIEIMNYVKENPAYLEFGIHGVGHEHFENGKRTRAEWYDLENNKPWPEEDSRAHLEIFKEIMAQYGITKENGHSFPESFVACAYGYYWNPEGNLSTGKLMGEYGVKYANTLFEEITELNPPIEFGGGFDNGVLTINRYNYGNEWFKLAALPTEPLEKYKTDIIETHWPNLLAQDDFLQKEVNQKWIEFYKNIQRSNSHYLAKNTEQLYSQWLYNRFAKVNFKNNEVEIDNTNMPQIAYDRNIIGNMVLKIKLEEGKHISKANINGKPISAYFEDEGYGFIYLPILKKEKYIVAYEINTNEMKRFVNNTGTYNVYDVNTGKKKFDFQIEMYGTQTVKVKSENPKKVESDNPNLKIVSQNFDNASNTLELIVSGRNMQGEEGKITLTF